MRLHIFNPEHDIALSYNRRHLTMPHVVQELRMNLGWIPALWAADGDVVLVDDVAYAVKASSRHAALAHDVLFLEKHELRGMSFQQICPWGWDVTLCTMLSEAGIPDTLLPSAADLYMMRHLSNRLHTTDALRRLREGIEADTCGQTEYVIDDRRAWELIKQWKDVVVKAPWSSSGRGVRYISGGIVPPTTQGFINNTTRLQGGIMMEPYYNKVKDFGMEFEIHSNGETTYCGLSLFSTQNGAYTGNLIATENEKTEILEKYVRRELLDDIRERMKDYLTTHLRGHYVGPLGVDMMIVASDNRQGFLLHPCVEINLRRTMGHVALAITPQDGLTPQKVMRVVHDVNYQLKISCLENNFVVPLP